MSSTENSYNDNSETAFSSPLPLLKKIKNLIFGEKNPNLLLRVTIYINLAIWFIFTLWHVLSYIAISFRALILEEKKVNVEILILNRGSELGYDPSVFMNRLLNFHFLSILLWIVIFVGIAMMWRLKSSFKFLIGIPLVLYLILMIFYLGFTYFKEDTTFFDKLAYFIFILNSFFYHFISQREENEIIE